MIRLPSIFVISTKSSYRDNIKNDCIEYDGTNQPGDKQGEFDQIDRNQYGRLNVNGMFVKKIDYYIGSVDDIKTYFESDMENDTKANDFFNFLFSSQPNKVKDIVVNVEGGNFVLGERTPKDDKLKALEWSSTLNKYVKNKIK